MFLVFLILSGRQLILNYIALYSSDSLFTIMNKIFYGGWGELGCNKSLTYPLVHTAPNQPPPATRLCAACQVGCIGRAPAPERYLFNYYLR